MTTRAAEHDHDHDHDPVAATAAAQSALPAEPQYQIDPRDLSPLQVADRIRAQPARRAEILHTLQQTRGNGFVQAVLAALATPQLRKDDPARAAALVQRIASGKEHLRIEGTPQFKQRIAQELLRLAATHTGRVVLEELLAGPRISKIAYRRERHEMSNHTAYVDPGAELALFGEDGKVIETPFHVLLLHELVHVVHEARGELTTTHAASHAAYTNAEEEATIQGAPPPGPRMEWHAPVDLSENAYRDEVNLPERFGHKAGDLDKEKQFAQVLRGVALDTYRLLAEFAAAKGQHRPWVPKSEVQIDEICDAMLALPDQYEATAEDVERTRVDARTALEAHTRMWAEPRRLYREHLGKQVAATNAALASALANDPGAGQRLTEAGLPHSLELGDHVTNWFATTTLLARYREVFPADADFQRESKTLIDQLRAVPQIFRIP